MSPQLAKAELSNPLGSSYHDKAEHVETPVVGEFEDALLAAGNATGTKVDKQEMLLPGLLLHNAKFGRQKFFNYRATSCLNAIVTRYDEYGNVQMLANVRPMDSDGDRGEFQMSAGTIAQFPDSDIIGFEMGATGPSQPPRLTAGKTDAHGKLLDHALIRARAGIHGKNYAGWNWLLHGQENDMGDHAKPWSGDPPADRVAANKAIADQLNKWNFYKVRAGIVDDSVNTNEAWVETAYVVHHIQGREDEELHLFQQGSPTMGKPNVGHPIWRNIDSTCKGSNTNEKDRPSGRPCGYNQYVTAKDKKYLFHNAEVQQAYDPRIEFDLWHGDHSMVLEQVAHFVRETFEFEGKAAVPAEAAIKQLGDWKWDIGSDKNWFGKSAPKATWLKMLEE
jgi:hypothetical protein